MTNRRLLTLIRSSMERSLEESKPQEAAQGLGALVLVQKDVIQELEKEVARLKLEKRYKRSQAA